MKLGEKILFLRKKKGLSQEALGERIDVTRQTISNWELGETQPNPDQLKLLSKELGVSIDELLDNDIQSILVEKVSNTEKLAGLILKILKIVLIGLPILFVTIIILSLLFRVIINKKDTGREIEENIHCSIYGEEHSYSVIYEELTNRPIAQGGDSYFDDILNLDQYDSAFQIFNVINDYVKKNGGTCTRFIGREANDVINMYIKEGTLTNSSATVVIETDYDYEITFGESFFIEKLDQKDNVYKRIEKDCLFNDIGYILKKDEPRELKQDWSYCIGDLPKGSYRLVKDITFDSDIPVDENDIYYIWTTFEIE